MAVMPMSEANRAAQGARMRAMHAARRAAGLPGLHAGHANTPETKARMSELARERYAEGRCGPVVGKPLRPTHESKLREAQKVARALMHDEAHPNWVGDKAGYNTIHDWVRRRMSLTGTCWLCGRTDRRTERSNIDHTYRRDLSDWREACRPCHRRWDKDHGLEAPGGQRGRLSSR